METSKNFGRGFAAACLGLVVSVCAHAQNPRDEINVMDQQIELLEKRARLDEARARAAGNVGFGLPQVIAIMGDGGAFVARLQQTNGVVGNYREGESIRGGMKVVSITRKQVSVVIGEGKKARAVPLDFIAGGTAAANGLPGIPGAPAIPLPGGRPPVPTELLPDPPYVPRGVTTLPRAQAAAPQAAAQPAAAAPAPAASATR